MVDDGPRAIEAMVDFDTGFGVAPAIGKDLEHVGSESDGVIIGDDARVLEAKDGVRSQVIGPGAIGELGPGGGSCEARIVAPEESGEEGVRRVLVGDASQAQFGHETILQRPEDALNTALRLGTGSGDPADPQLLEEASDLSWGTHAP